MAKHLSNAPTDSGLSYIWDALTYGREPKHAAPMAEWEKELISVGWLPFADGDSVIFAHPHKYNDAWSGNPDTDKYWSK